MFFGNPRGKRRFHKSADGVQSGLRFGFKAQHKHGLGIGCANKAPSIGKDQAYAVYFQNVVAFPKVAARFFYDWRLDFLRAGHEQFRGDKTFLPAEQGRKGSGTGGENGGKARGGVQGVVKAVPAIGKEHVPAHLPAQFRADFAHFCLHEGMPCGAHDPLAAVVFNVAKEPVRAFNIAENERVGFSGQHLASQKRKQLITEQEPAAFVNRANPVGIAIKAKAEVGVAGNNQSLKVGHVRLHNRVRMVVGEGAVRLAEKWHNLRAHALKKLNAVFPSRAVAAVDNNLEGAGQRYFSSDIRAIYRENVANFVCSHAGWELPVFHRFVQGGYLFAVQGGGAAPDLEPVILCRIVAGGYHNACRSAVVFDGVVEHWRGNHADVNNVDAGFPEASDKSASVFGRGIPAVSADNSGYLALFAKISGAGLSEAVNPLGVKVGINETSDIIGAKNVWGYGPHGKSPKKCYVQGVHKRKNPDRNVSLDQKVLLPYCAGTMNWDWEKLQEKRQRQPGGKMPPKDSPPTPPKFPHFGEKFKNFTFTSFPGGKFLILAAAVLWGLSGFFIISPDEEGVILRFGKYNRTVSPGPHLRLPFPIETHLAPKVTQVRRIEVGFRSPPNMSSVQSQVRAVPEEASMLTSDENIVNVQFIIQYRIVDSRKFLFNLARQDETVKSAGEAAMREAIGKSKIDAALTEGKMEIQMQTQQLLQAILERYDAGISVLNVQMQDVHAPKEVMSAFRDVASAREDKVRSTNEAEAYRNKFIPEAQGVAARIVNEAEAHKEAVVRKAQGESQRFLSVLAEYNKAKDVTKRRMYLESMEGILSAPGMEKIILPKDFGNKMLPLLPLGMGGGSPSSAHSAQGGGGK